jgi:hypothetical protein
MQFTFKREAIAIGVFLFAPLLSGLLVALLAPLFLR